MLCEFVRQDKIKIILSPNSMQQSPSWEANSLSDSERILLISQSPKVYYRIHNIPTLVPIQINPYPTAFP